MIGLGTGALKIYVALEPQDMRKSCVFDFATKYGPVELRETFARKAKEFFEESLSGVSSFDTPSPMRPSQASVTATPIVPWPHMPR